MLQEGANQSEFGLEVALQGTMVNPRSGYGAAVVVDNCCRGCLDCAGAGAALLAHQEEPQGEIP
jgi:hypothetical protein